MRCKNLFPNTVILSHTIINHIVDRGDYVVDATAGNGHDTVFLARLVGHEGKVYSFDIQEEAIIQTKSRLIKEELSDRVELLWESHDLIDKYVDEKISAVMFNLGYLPGSDQQIKTKTNTTLRALNKSLELLNHGGVITIVVYTGHDGGLEEGISIEKWIKLLNAKIYHVVKLNYLNKLQDSPYIICIQKFAEKEPAK